MTYPAPALQPEPDRKKTAVAVELAPIPQTCGELFGYSEAWSDEMSYLADDMDKYEKEYAYASYMAAKFAWVTVALRNRPEYTSEHRFAQAEIDDLMAQYDTTFPERVVPEYLRLPEELEKVFGNVKEICKDLNDKIKAGKPISKDDVIKMKFDEEPDWDTGSTYKDDFKKLNKYKGKGDSDGAFVEA